MATKKQVAEPKPKLTPAQRAKQKEQERKMREQERKRQAKWIAERKKREADRMKALATFFKAHPLPKGLLLSDFEHCGYKKQASYPNGEFEIWYIGSSHRDSDSDWGWVIPTLHISNPGRRHAADAARRTYAVRVSNGGQVRVGLGPHVLKQLYVYVKKSRLKALQPYLEMRQTGLASASATRDRISTRRMLTEQRRRIFW